MCIKIESITTNTQQTRRTARDDSSNSEHDSNVSISPVCYRNQLPYIRATQSRKNKIDLYRVSRKRWLYCWIDFFVKHIWINSWKGFVDHRKPTEMRAVLSNSYRLLLIWFCYAVYFIHSQFSCRHFTINHNLCSTNYALCEIIGRVRHKSKFINTNLWVVWGQPLFIRRNYFRKFIRIDCSLVWYIEIKLYNSCDTTVADWKLKQVSHVPSFIHHSKQNCR